MTSYLSKNELELTYFILLKTHTNRWEVLLIEYLICVLQKRIHRKRKKSTSYDISREMNTVKNWIQYLPFGDFKISRLKSY